MQELAAFSVAQFYFADKVPLGTVAQSFGAFSLILNVLSLANRFDQLSWFGAGIERRGEYLIKTLTEEDHTFGTVDEKKSSNDGDYAEKSSQFVNGVGHASSNSVQYSNGTVSTTNGSNGVTGESLASLTIELMETTSNGLAFSTPSGGVPRTLINNLTMELKPGQRLLVAGPSVIGRSALLRGIFGLRTNGTGTIERPVTSLMLFLPQRPYCTLCLLSANLLYTNEEIEANIPSNDALLVVLVIFHLFCLPVHLCQYLLLSPSTMPLLFW